MTGIVACLSRQSIQPVLHGVLVNEKLLGGVGDATVVPGVDAENPVELLNAIRLQARKDLLHKGLALLGGH